MQNMDHNNAWLETLVEDDKKSKANNHAHQPAPATAQSNAQTDFTSSVSRENEEWFQRVFGNEQQSGTASQGNIPAGMQTANVAPKRKVTKHVTFANDGKADVEQPANEQSIPVTTTTASTVSDQESRESYLKH